MSYSTPQRNEICSTCPFSRSTTKEYLDTRGDNGFRFLAQANMNAVLPCHTEDKGIATVGKCRQCAGAAKFRANIGVKNLSPGLGTLPADKENVFESNAELLAHHKGWTVEEAQRAIDNGALEREIKNELTQAIKLGMIE